MTLCVLDVTYVGYIIDFAFQSEDKLVFMHKYKKNIHKGTVRFKKK